jgi:hypothetical protein
MKCKTSEFSEALQLAKPALSLNNILPVMQSYSFTGKTVFTYNDFLAIGIALETPFVAAISGDALHKCVATMRSEEMSFVQDGDSLLIKTGRSKLAFTTLPETSFALNPDELEDNILATLEVDRVFTEGLEAAMLSIDTQFFYDVYGSVGLELIEGKPLKLYSTDDQTLTRVQLPKTVCPNMGDFPEDVILLPNDFCKQYLKLYKHFFADHNGTVKLSLSEQYLLCDFGKDYGWLLVELPDAEKIPYDEVFQDSMPATEKDEWLRVDDDLKAIFLRAAALHKLGVNRNAIQETLYLSEGANENEVKIEQDTGDQDLSETWVGGISPETNISVNPALMLRAIKSLSEAHWASGDVIVFRNGDYITHLISVGD